MVVALWIVAFCSSDSNHDVLCNVVVVLHEQNYTTKYTATNISLYSLALPNGVTPILDTY